MSEGNGSYTKVMLTRAQAFQAAKWLKANRQRLLEHNATREQIAAEVAAALGVPVSVGNIQGICEDFQVKPMWRVKPRPAKSPAEIAANQSAKGHLARLVGSQVLALADEVEKLCKALGEPFNADGRLCLDTLRKAVASKIPIDSVREVADQTAPAEADSKEIDHLDELGKAVA